MGSITIEFVGVCTHLPAVGPNQPHRVVVIQNPKQITFGTNSVIIAPHTARIQAGPESIVQGLLPTDLSGYKLSIDEPSGLPNVSYDLTWRSIPSLSLYSNAPLGLKRDVAFADVFSLQPPEGLAVTYFDVLSGAFSVGLVNVSSPVTANRRSVGATVTIQTQSDTPTLKFTAIGSNAQIEPVVFKDKTTLEISNDASLDASDQDSDFLLHYEIASFPASTPPNPTFPTVIEFSGLQDLSGIGGGHDITTGCSNSTYP